MASGFNGLAPYRRLAGLADRYVPDWVAPLITRLAVAAVYFMSGRTKVDGLLVSLMLRGGGALSLDRVLKIP